MSGPWDRHRCLTAIAVAVVALLLGVGAATSVAGLPTDATPASDAATTYQCTGSQVTLFDNWNGEAVDNGGTQPTFNTGGQAYCLISISDYHWNNAQGATPGTIGLLSESGNVGPFDAAGGPGSDTEEFPNGVPNADWAVTLGTSNPTVIDGTYACDDSDPSTWSQNATSGGNGFCEVTGEPAEPETSSTETETTTTPTTTTETTTTEATTTTAPPPHTTCPLSITGAGIFEPTQAVWQDDPFHILHPPALADYLMVNGPGQATARLDMVLDRPTLMFGAYQGPMKRSIVLTGTTSYTGLVPVGLRFKLTQAGKTVVLFNAPPGAGPGKVQPLMIKLAPPCGKATPFTLTLTVKTGIGEGAGVEGQPFKFAAVGKYALSVVGVAGGAEIPQIQGNVDGMVVKTFPPSLNFIPASLYAKAGATVQTALVAAATKISTEAQDHFPDYLPIAGRPPVHVDPYTDLSTLPTRNAAFQQKAAKIGVPTRTVDLEEPLASVVDDLGKATIVDGYSRTIVVVRKPDLANTKAFTAVIPDDEGDEVVKVAKGVTVSPKVIFLEVDANHYSLAHELAHSLGFLWSDDAANPSLTRDCHIDLHNAHPDRHAAYGFQIYDGGNLVRKWRDGSESLMGRAGNPAGIWIDQCTYKHFLDHLQGKPPDPSVTLMSGLLARHDGRYAGQLDPGREFTGALDPPAGGGPLSLVIRDSAGRRLARYRFRPVWELSEGNARLSIVSFQFAIHLPSGAASLELDGPAGALDRESLSSPARDVAFAGGLYAPAYGTGTAALLARCFHLRQAH